MEYPERAECEFWMNTHTKPFIQEKLTKQQIEQKVKEEKMQFALRVLLISERVDSDETKIELIGRAGLEYVKKVNKLLFNENETR